MRTKSEAEIGVRDQGGGLGLRHTEDDGKERNVDGDAGEGRVAEERVEGDDDENDCLLGIGPLQRVVWVQRGHGEQCLAVAGVVAICLVSAVDADVELAKRDVPAAWRFTVPGMSSSWAWLKRSETSPQRCFVGRGKCTCE